MTAASFTSPFAREAKFLALPPARIRPDGLFEGYASLFGIADLGKDIVERGAFRDSLTRRGPAGIKLLGQHDPAEPIGRWITLTEDSRGLLVRGQLSLAVARAREIHALMREGAIDGLSIGFRYIESAPLVRSSYKAETHSAGFQLVEKRLAKAAQQAGRPTVVLCQRLDVGRRELSSCGVDAAYAVDPAFWASVLPAVRERHPDAWFMGE